MLVFEWDREIQIPSSSVRFVGANLIISWEVQSICTVQSAGLMPRQKKPEATLGRQGRKITPWRFMLIIHGHHVRKI